MNAFAFDIEGVGTVVQEINGSDTLLFFKDEVHLRSTIGDVDWYRTEDNTLVASGTDEIYPDDGGYYIQNGSYTSSPIYAFLYSDAAEELTLTVEPDCGATTLRVQGDVAPFNYTRSDGTSGSYARACSVQYTALAWDSEQWTDSAVSVKNTLHEGNYILDPLYGATSIAIYYDSDLRIALGLDSIAYYTSVAPEEVRAVKMMLTSLATPHTDSEDKNNELDSPTKQDIITSSSTSTWSAPLEVAFYANPTPGVKFCTWQIYHGAELIITRQGEEIRNAFAEPGSYRVVCKVNNQYCTSDSMEVIVAISSSFLSVPNVFTPNGDGKNDEFRVAYRSIKEFHCWVYNRWGKLVYEWSDPAKGWNGMIGNRPASEGAYFYVIRALGTDAAPNAQYMSKIAYQNKKNKDPEAILGIYQLSGDINLIR